MLRNFLARVFKSTPIKAAPPAASSTGYIEKAKAAFEQGNYPEARKFYLLELGANGHTTTILSALGATEALLGEYARAEQRFKQALLLSPTDLDSRLGLANIKLLSKHYNEAIDIYRDLLNETPENVAIRNNLNIALSGATRYNELESSYLQILSNTPNDSETLAALSSLYVNLNRHTEALEVMNRSGSCSQSDVLSTIKQSHIYLQQGNLEKGWNLYEARLSLPDKLIIPAEPPWNGIQPSNKKIVVYDEQGFGDAVMFLRFLPRLQALAKEIEFVCRPELYSLIQASFNIPLRKMEASTGASAQDAYSCHLLSLPYLLGLNQIIDLGMSSAYLKPSKRAAEKFSFLHALNSGVRIGLVWAGNPTRDDDITRTLAFHDLLHLMNIPQVSWFILQKGRVTPPEILQKSCNLAEHIVDFNDMAAAMLNLDAIISVDTAAAHLAGALGKETFVIEPYIDNWRWRIHTTESPWYPSAHLFKAINHPTERWKPAVTALKQHIATRFSST